MPPPAAPDSGPDSGRDIKIPVCREVTVPDDSPATPGVKESCCLVPVHTGPYFQKLLFRDCTYHKCSELK